MRGVNKVILVGNLGADPEVRHTGGGTPIAEIRIATSEQWTDKQSGEKQERTEWHRIVFLGKLADVVGEYLRKGAQVYVEGSLRTEKYTDKDGVERWATKVMGRELQMLGGKRDAGGERQPAESRSDRSKPSEPPKQDAEFDDDDIPF